MEDEREKQRRKPLCMGVFEVKIETILAEYEATADSHGLGIAVTIPMANQKQARVKCHSC